MEPKSLKAIVVANSAQITFSTQIHRADAEHELFMDPELFYKKYNPVGAQIIFPHHEIELREMKIGIGQSTLSFDLNELVASGKYHWRNAERARNQVLACLTVRVESLDNAREYLGIFAMGTFYTLFTDEDFAAAIKNAGGNQKFFEQVQKMYGASLCFEE